MAKKKRYQSNRVSVFLVNLRTVIDAILELGNGILANLGVEEKIDDVGVFFR